MTINSLNNEFLNNLSISTATAGVTRKLTVQNTDNSNAASHAKIAVTTGGASGGDPFSITSTTATSSSIGIDNSDSDLFKVSMSNAVETTTSLKIDSGNILRPLQPAFHAYRTSGIANVTGNGATYGPIVYDNEGVDQNGDYNTATGIFTAPITGKYLFIATCRIGGTTLASFCRTDIVTTDYTYYSNYSRPGANRVIQQMGNIVAPMDAGDTASVYVICVGEAGNTDDIMGRIYDCFFCGALMN